MSDKKFQTRSEETGLGYHDSLDAALEFTKKDVTIHKITFSVFHTIREIVTLEKSEDGQWVLRPPFQPGLGALPSPGMEWMIGRTVEDIEKIHAEAVVSGKTTDEVSKLPHWSK